MIKIYGYGRSRSVKCVWMARELGLEFEYIDLKHDGKGFGGEDYLKINPFRTSPGFDDGEVTLFESQAIVNYLGEKYPEHRMIPKSGTLERAQYDQWVFCAVTTVELPLWSWFRHSYIFDAATKNTQEIERSARELRSKLEVLNGLLANTEFLIGDRFTAADLTMAYTLNWARPFGHLDGLDALQDYMGRHTRREHFPADLYEKRKS